MTQQAIERLLVLGSVALAAFLISWQMIMFLRPWLARFALARPNSRSSHRVATPQGGGLAVVAATLAVAWLAIALAPGIARVEGCQFLALTAAAALLATVGAIDDIRSLPAALRLLLQCIAVGGVLAAVPQESQLLPQVPWWIERAGLFLGGLWLVNLVNFMDGIDWMTVAEIVPVTGAIVVLGLSGTIQPLPAMVAAALLGAILGFAPFNKPVARLFLGDVGSLPIGLLLGWLLLRLTESGHVAAVAILPLYYVADATLTLAGRIARGEEFWRAHRTHFYQRATDNGFTIAGIVSRVFMVNLVLLVLALLTVVAGNVVVSVLSIAAAAAIVGWLLAAFARGNR
jgi:UDP-N-acetylmuramyl pentapeptide phosphotransferase/UDP-N-acetylglucosamine-1-phosphate transferase